MNKYERKKLNLKRLLNLRELDVREIAAKNKNIIADEYFSKVEIFIEQSSKLKDILQELLEFAKSSEALKEFEMKNVLDDDYVKIEENKKRVKDLELIKATLTEIGYEKLNSSIDNACNIILSKNQSRIQYVAMEIFDTFTRLTDRLKSSYSARGADPEQRSSVLLRDVLRYLDHEEANRKLRILAVDDVAVVLNTIVSVLSPQYEVFALKNSSQVSKFLSHTTPELFLLDIEMHDMHGFELIPIIRKYEEHRDTPIIFLTGNASVKNLKEAISLGACDFITKPVNREILLEKIEKNIVRKKAY